jgi:hypothetical protein
LSETYSRRPAREALIAQCRGAGAQTVDIQPWFTGLVRPKSLFSSKLGEKKTSLVLSGGALRRSNLESFLMSGTVGKEKLMEII